MVTDTDSSQLLLPPTQEQSSAPQAEISLGLPNRDLLNSNDTTDHHIFDDLITPRQQWHEDSVIADAEMRDRHAESDPGAPAVDSHNPVVIICPRYSPTLHPFERRFAGSQAGQPSDRPHNQALSSPTGSAGSRDSFASELRLRLDGKDEGTGSAQDDSTEVDGRVWPNSRSWVSQPMVRALGLILLWYTFSMCLSL